MSITPEEQLSNAMHAFRPRQIETLWLNKKVQHDEPSHLLAETLNIWASDEEIIELLQNNGKCSELIGTLSFTSTKLGQCAELLKKKSSEQTVWISSCHGCNDPCIGCSYPVQKQSINNLSKKSYPLYEMTHNNLHYSLKTMALVVFINATK
mmetsp:Transcript_1943/g.2580  ORF Transcript_1943/g.2580 Transcript_1943/m.2580 type:complete len:152 (-) Transcript_1943:1469-1924(-)